MALDLVSPATSFKSRPQRRFQDFVQNSKEFHVRLNNWHDALGYTHDIDLTLIRRVDTATLLESTHYLDHAAAQSSVTPYGMISLESIEGLLIFLAPFQAHIHSRTTTAKNL